VRGVGTATGAISIVNALPTGVGSAVGVDLPARAELDLHPAGSSEKWDVRIADDARSPLVIEALTQALRRFAPGTSGRGELTVRSTVPVGRGLKSSSAVSSAVVLAAARATETPVTAVEVAQISAHASIVAGVSATGAFDDALAGLSTGIVVTDNARGELLRSIPLDATLGVALYVPTASHAPSPGLRAEFEREAVASSHAIRAAIDGDWPTAMTRNSELVERVMGYDYARARAALREAGAVGCGVSGLGPALAAVAPSPHLREISSRLPGSPGERRTLALSKVGAFPEESRP
jgi:shikimate kinase